MRNQTPITQYDEDGCSFVGCRDCRAFPVQFVRDWKRGQACRTVVICALLGCDELTVATEIAERLNACGVTAWAARADGMICDANVYITGNAFGDHDKLIAEITRKAIRNARNEALLRRECA